MAKRWINSMDVEVSANGAPLFGTAGCASLNGGTKTVTSAATPESLVAESTPCRFVWLGARVDNSGNPLNTSPCFVGDMENQNIPLMPSNYEGMILNIDDAAKIFIRVVADGEGLAYRIFA